MGGKRIVGWGDALCCAVTHPTLVLGLLLGMGQTAWANSIEIDPKLLESSPTLQKWLDRVPDVRSEIKNDPAFRTRLRVGYGNFDESEVGAGFQLGVEDLRLGRTAMTLSTHYRSNGTGSRRNFGADVHYQLLPLGAVVNVAPMVGYRRLTLDDQGLTGLNLGLRTRLNLSRGGGADITIDQSWVAPGSDQEAGLTRFSFGYAITQDLRLSTDWQQQNTKFAKENQWGIAIEWMP